MSFGGLKLYTKSNLALELKPCRKYFLPSVSEAMIEDDDCERNTLPGSAIST